MAGPLTVEVVSATGIAWEGKAISVIARTTEGDIGRVEEHVSHSTSDVTRGERADQITISHPGTSEDVAASEVLRGAKAAHCPESGLRREQPALRSTFGRSEQRTTRAIYLLGNLPEPACDRTKAGIIEE